MSEELLRYEGRTEGSTGSPREIIKVAYTCFDFIEEDIWLSMLKDEVSNLEDKTNVMRLLEQKKIPYASHCYLDTNAVSGVEVAAVLEQNPAQVFKTLLTVGKSGQHYVFVIPVAEELDLKKAAKAVGEKSVEMLKSKDLLPLTGYIHGGCSPIGMKKYFKTTIDQSVTGLETMIFSAGKIGYQVELKPEDLKKILRYEVKELTVTPDAL